MNSRERYDRLLAIESRLAELDAEDWLQKRLAAKILRCFPDDPIQTIDIFTEKGWSPSDIFHWLANAPAFKRTDPSWADSFRHIFLVEEVLVGAGLSQQTSHSLVLTQAWLFHIPPVTLEVAMRALIELGYQEDVIRSIANKMPHLFHLLPEHISEECKAATHRQRGLLWNTKLQTYQPPKPFTPRYVQSVKPVARKAVKKAEVGPVQPEPTEEQESDIKTITPEIKVRPKALRPLRLFNPMEAETAAKVLKQPQVAMEGAGEDDCGDADDSVEFLPLELATHALPNTSTLSHDDGTRLHLDKIRDFIRVAIPQEQNYDDSSENNEPEDVWETFLLANPWLKYSESIEYQACAVLLRWVPLNAFGGASSFREDTEAGLRYRFWRKVLLSEKYRGVLQIFANTLELRLYILRRIGRNFVKAPSWILKPWEILDEAELRYRLNEIDAQGKEPKFKPYINMLLEPKREKFQKRLSRFLSTKARHERYCLEPDDDALIYDTDQKPHEALTSEELRARLLADRKKK